MKRISALATAAACFALSAMPGTAKVKPPQESAKFWLPLCRNFDPTCVGYLQAMLDSVSLDKANGRAPYWCSSQNITLAQIRRIIIVKLDTQREQWKQPFIVLATKALQEKFPCPAPSGDSRENRPSEPSLEGNSTQIEFPEISASTILEMQSPCSTWRGEACHFEHAR